ncbi:MAG: C25 family cysteine peptidase [Thermodesulfobacteriota bacterium]
MKLFFNSLVMPALVVCGLLFVPVEAHWVGADRHQPGPPVLSTLDSNPSRLVVDIQIPGIYMTEVSHQGVRYHDISIPGGGHATNVGKPSLPTLGRYVALPRGAKASVKVVDARFKEMTGYNVAPAQDPLPESGSGVARVFKKDATAYGQRGFSPARIVELESPVTIRGCRTALLRVFPVQFNPAEQTIRVYSHVTVQVSFEGGDRRFVEKRWRSKSTTPVFENLFLNNPVELDTEAGAETGSGSVMSRSATDEQSFFLIISPPELVSAANKLANWKRAQGVSTEVRTTDQAGSTTAEIKAFIQEAYDTWPVPPDYVLLMGDVEFIPTNRGDGCGTDLYYATVDGTDFFPDLSIGRLSVDTLDQALKRVDDIIGYELSPPTQESFYQNAAIVAYFQDSDFNGTADRRFVQSAEDMAIFFSDPAYLDAYDVDRIYYTDSRATPLRWNDDNWNFGTTGVLSGAPGEDMPAYLLRSGGLAWDGDAADISAAVNNGRFLVAYRGHGQTTRWDSVTYTTADVSALANADLLPVVFSVTCLSGKFDMESSGINIPCFSESWERNPDGGAVGILAASETSYSGYNDHFFWGWMEALWPEEFPAQDPPSGTPFDPPALEMGPMLNYGKYYGATKYSEGDDTLQLEFELFHWFGDPTMRLWTGVPQDFTVSGFAIDAGSGGLEITMDQAGAVICVSRNGTILGKAVSSGGTDRVACDPPLEADDAVLVVVTKPGFRPYVGMTREDTDGLSTWLEILTGTNPGDSDTDDDGIPDDVEDANVNGAVDEGETDPRRIDTDGDGLQDGTEQGYTLADVHDDTDTGVFQPDLDDTTTTDPLNPDTDGDCALDGGEDADGNGRVDAGETDPEFYDNLLPPAANAGADQSVREGSTVRLDGTGSTDACQTALSFFWEQVSGPAVTLFDAASSRPTFTAPSVDAAGAVLSFRLTVDDGFGLASTDTCQITVTNVVAPPPVDDDDDDDDDDEGPVPAAGGGGGGGGCFIGTALSM